MNFSLTSSGAIVLVAFTAGSCGSLPVTYDQTQYVSNTDSYIGYGVNDRDLMVEIYGNPFDEPADRVDHALTSGLQGSGVNTHFILAPTDRAQTDFRVVLAFAGQKGGSNLCSWSSSVSHWPQTIRGQAGKVTLVATLCDQDKPITSVTGSVAATSAADPAMASLLHHMAIDLFPLNNEYHSS